MGKEEIRKTNVSKYFAPCGELSPEHEADYCKLSLRSVLPGNVASLGHRLRGAVKNTA